MEKFKVEWTNERKEKALRVVMAYLEKHGTSEHIGQDEDAQIDAISLASDLSDAAEVQWPNGNPYGPINSGDLIY